MDDEADIVAQLREEAFITHMARLPRESKILHAAADEIERLRSERDELQKWKDAHNTFWRDRAERRDAMREGEKKR